MFRQFLSSGFAFSFTSFQTNSAISPINGLTVTSFHLMIILYEAIKSNVVLKKWLALEMAVGIKSKIQKDD